MTGESETNASSEEAVSPPAAASAVDPIIDSQLSFADSLLRGKVSLKAADRTSHMMLDVESLTSSLSFFFIV